MGDVITFTPPAEAGALAPQVTSTQARALAAVITDAESYAYAGDLLISIATLRKGVEAAFDPLIRHAHETHAAIIAEKKRHVGPLDESERELKGRISVYLLAEEKKRREEELRMRELARKEAEERAIAEAVQLEAEGDAAGAAAVLADPTPAPLVVVQSSVPKVAGLSSRETWDFEVTDASLIPREYLAVDMVRIRGVVKALKGSTSIPGVRAFAVKTMAVTTGARR